MRPWTAGLILLALGVALAAAGRGDPSAPHVALGWAFLALGALCATADAAIGRRFV